jgi:hypothetical protein
VLVHWLSGGAFAATDRLMAATPSASAGHPWLAPMRLRSKRPSCRKEGASTWSGNGELATWLTAETDTATFLASLMLTSPDLTRETDARPVGGRE